MPTGSAPVTSKKTAPLISDNKLREIYAAMLRRRMLAPAAREKKQIFPAATEAPFVGTTIDLLKQDTIAAPPAFYFRDGLRIGKDVLRPADCAPPVKDSAALAGIATGLALARKGEKSGGVVVAFVESAPAQSCWTDLLAFAALHALPILYVLQAATEQAATAVPAIPVDENDVVAVYRVAQEAIARARQGIGPTVLECRPWLLTGTARKRAPAQERSQDPLRFMQDYLTGKGLFTPAWKRKLEERFRHELSVAAVLARSTNRP